MIVGAPRDDCGNTHASSCSDSGEHDARGVSIDNRDFLVSSTKGDIKLSFSVPGLISIPSDNDYRTVCIQQY